MRKLFLLLLLLIWTCGLLFSGCYPWDDEELNGADPPDEKLDYVEFKNLEIEQFIGNTFGKGEGEVTVNDLKAFTKLNLSRFFKGDTVDLGFLQYAENLEILILTEVQVPSLEPITGLKNLRELNIDDCNIEDISALADLENLQELSAKRNSISNISPLANKPNLINLSLLKNRITDVSPLEGNIALETLGLRDNQIKDISSLANLTRLRWIVLCKNPITDISPLANLTGLESISIEFTDVTDVLPLINLKGLEIYAGGTDIPQEQVDTLQEEGIFITKHFY